MEKFEVTEQVMKYKTNINQKKEENYFNNS